MENRYEHLRSWMRQFNVTFAYVGKNIGISRVGAMKVLKSERISPERHQQLVALRFPPELLPIADPKCRRGPRVPTWECNEASIPAYQPAVTR